jgi:hypothetical protein
MHLYLPSLSQEESQSSHLHETITPEVKKLTSNRSKTVRILKLSESLKFMKDYAHN